MPPTLYIISKYNANIDPALHEPLKRTFLYPNHNLLLLIPKEVQSHHTKQNIFSSPPRSPSLNSSIFSPETQGKLSVLYKGKIFMLVLHSSTQILSLWRGRSLWKQERVPPHSSSSQVYYSVSHLCFYSFCFLYLYCSHPPRQHRFSLNDQTLSLCAGIPVFTIFCACISILYWSHSTMNQILLFI